VRQLAAKLGLPTAKKPDSQGICFVGEVGIREFLRQYLETEAGPIVLATTGAQLGRHQGAQFYTHGQRHGLGLGGGQPLYVTATDVATNTVYVTADPSDLALTADRFKLTSTHWINEPPAANTAVLVRARHRAEFVPGAVTPGPTGAAVQLDHPERAIMPGQSAVLYEPETHRVIGGGVIA